MNRSIWNQWLGLGAFLGLLVFTVPGQAQQLSPEPPAQNFVLKSSGNQSPPVSTAILSKSTSQAQENSQKNPFQTAGYVGYGPWAYPSYYAWSYPYYPFYTSYAYNYGLYYSYPYYAAYSWPYYGYYGYSYPFYGYGYGYYPYYYWAPSAGLYYYGQSSGAEGVSERVAPSAVALQAEIPSTQLVAAAQTPRQESKIQLASFEVNPSSKFDPNSAMVHYGRGCHAFWSGDFSAAFECFETAVKYYPEDARIWYFKGLAEAGLGENDSATQSFGRALQLEVAGKPARKSIDQAISRVQGRLRVQLEEARRDLSTN
ncbi:Hypothetical protein PBC10988_37510 [Planctomycetales bacterium 10988]|nr:Hypothetical protein PBC10988_37510 [Planctomycetales bacterium 10988]